MNYQRIIKGNMQHIGKQYDYFLFTYIPYQHAWVFTTYFDLDGHIIDPKNLWSDSIAMYEANLIANSLYVESGLWVI